MVTVREGSRGPEVVELQWLLRATGHDPGPLDGILGPRTALAVRDEETARIGWPIDLAEMDPEHMAALRALPRVAVEMPRLHTPTTLEVLRSALAAGYAAVFGDVAEALALASLAVRVALAQLAVEHGADYSAIWSNNLGNRQVRHEDRAFAQSGYETPLTPFYRLRSREVVRGRDVELVADYYAYPPGPTGLEEGAAAYWRALRDHYPQSLVAFEAGAPAAAALKLKEEGWYTGSEADYARAMVDRYTRPP